MINQAFYEGKYVPGNPVTRGCVYCNTWKGKLVFVLIFVISIGIGGYGLLNRYTEYSEAQALLVQEYNLDGLKPGSSENSDVNANDIGKTFPNISICNVNPIVVNHLLEDENIKQTSKSVYVDLLYFDGSTTLPVTPEIEARYLHLLTKIFDGALKKEENYVDLNNYFDIIFDGSDSISTWANVLRNSLIPVTDPLYLAAPNNLTDYLLANPDKVLLAADVAADAWTMLNKNTEIDIQFRNKTFTNLLYNSINLGGIYTTDYQAGLESILPTDMISYMTDNYFSNYDQYLTSIEVMRAPFALDFLNRRTKLGYQNPYGQLKFLDRNNNSLETLTFSEQNLAVEKILEDFSWIENKPAPAPIVVNENVTLYPGKNHKLTIENYHLSGVSLGTGLNLTTQLYTSRFGQCLQIKSDENIKQKANGLQFGLRLLVNAGKLVNDPWHDFTGLLVMIHEFDNPFPLHDQNFYYIPLKSTAEISMIETSKIRLTSPKGTCDGEGMSINQCLEQCEIRKLSETCNCKIPFDLINENELPNNCSWYDIRYCDVNSVDFNYDDCECKKPCTEKIIESQINTIIHDQNPAFWSSTLGSSMISQNISDNQAEMIFYYSNLQVNVFEEKEGDDMMKFLFDAIVIVAAFTGFTIAGCCEGIVCLVFNCCCKKWHSPLSAGSPVGDGYHRYSQHTDDLEKIEPHFVMNNSSKEKLTRDHSKRKISTPNIDLGGPSYIPPRDEGRKSDVRGKSKITFIENRNNNAHSYYYQDNAINGFD